MLSILVILCILIWLPILLYYMTDKSLAILLAWLFIAPIALNLLDHPNDNPFFSVERDLDYTEQFLLEKTKQEARQKGIRKGYRSPKETIRIDELLVPTRFLLLALVLTLLMDRYFRKRPLEPFDNAEYCMLGFLVLLVINIFLLSSRLANSLKLATDSFFIPFVAYYVTRRFVKDDTRLRQLTNMLIAFGLMMTLIAIVERLGHSHLLYRLRGPFAQRNQFYVVLMAVFFMTLLDTVRSPHARGQPLTLRVVCRRVVLCSMPIIIFLTWTRSNWLGFLAAIWVVLFFARRFIPRGSKVAMIGLVMLLIPMFVVGFYTLIPAEAIDNRIANENTIYSRLGAWIVQWQAGIRHPILGIGFTDVRELLYNNQIYFHGVRSLVHSHNCFLALFVEVGIPGLLLYLGMAMSIIRAGVKQFRRTARREHRWLGIASIAILVAHLVPGFTSTILYVPTVSHVYVFTCLGALAGVAGASGVPVMRIRRMEPERIPAA